MYDPAEQRKVDLRLGDFETATLKARKKWKGISLKNCFPSWMANHEYREDYFKNPEYIVDQLEAAFIPFAIQFLKDELKKIEQDQDTLITIKDVSALFRFYSKPFSKDLNTATIITSLKELIPSR